MATGILDIVDVVQSLMENEGAYGTDHVRNLLVFMCAFYNSNCVGQGEPISGGIKMLLFQAAAGVLVAGRV